jgi:hypothetical protein
MSLFPSFIKVTWEEMYLSRHATAESDFPVPLPAVGTLVLSTFCFTFGAALCDELEHDSRGEFVVSLATALRSLEYVDGIPRS